MGECKQFGSYQHRHHISLGKTKKKDTKKQRNKRKKQRKEKKRKAAVYGLIALLDLWVCSPPLIIALQIIFLFVDINESPSICLSIPFRNHHVSHVAHNVYNTAGDCLTENDNGYDTL